VHVHLFLRITSTKPFPAVNSKQAYYQPANKRAPPLAN
jgi:hypothetical protein